MNPRTNELIDTTGKSKNELDMLSLEGFQPIPNELESAARKKLAGRKSTKVSWTSGGKLSNWAKKLRRNLGQEE